MKIGIKDVMSVADEMTSSVLGSHVRICAQSAQIYSCSHFFGEKLPLELSEGHKNWHEGGDGGCQQNDSIRFGIAHAQCANPLDFRVF